MFNFVTPSGLFFHSAMFIIGLILALIPISRYCKWKKTRLKSDSYWESSHTDFDDYLFDDDDNHTVSNVCAFIFGTAILAVGFFSLCGNVKTIVQNRIDEPAVYASYVARQETIQDALMVTEDVVNTELYSSAIGFNSQLAQIQAKYHTNFYSLNFTGDCDWDAIKPIDLYEVK